MYTHKQLNTIVKTDSVYECLDIGYFFMEALNEQRDAECLMLSGKAIQISGPWYLLDL